MLKDKSILLIISGGIAAYKALELIRLLKTSGATVRCILTDGGAHFVTPLSVAALSGETCYTDLWSLTDEAEMGHIRLSREADLVIVAPASADIIAKMAHGLCNDLATTCLLATNKPVMIAPAMNPAMWDNPATRANINTLQSRDITVLSPAYGVMACGETGQGRMMEPEEILRRVMTFFTPSALPLTGKHAIVTSGPTIEPIDPVRYIGNRSSGKQGHAIACALRDAGADVTYITGPTALPAPHGVKPVLIETAAQMMQAADNALPADIFVGAAAVADYGITPTAHKQKKEKGKTGLNITWHDNPDILKTISTLPHGNRPSYVVGFAAETDHVTDHARAKLLSKGCDMIVANQVGDAANPVFGSDMTSVILMTKYGEMPHKNLSKQSVADIIVDTIIDHFSVDTNTKDTAA